MVVIHAIFFTQVVFIAVIFRPIVGGMKTMLMNLKIIAWFDFWISNHDFFISHFDFTVSQFAISYHYITDRNQDIPMLSWGTVLHIVSCSCALATTAMMAPLHRDVAKFLPTNYIYVLFFS